MRDHNGSVNGRHVLPRISADHSRSRGLEDRGAAGSEKTHSRKRAELAATMSVKNLNYYVEGRLFEWTMGLSTFMCGVEFLIWPNSIERSTFLFLELILGPYALATVLLLLGWSRITALMLNGQRIFKVKAGPWVRAGCCIISAILWTQFVIALSILAVSQDTPTPGLPFWAMFTVAELYAAYLAVKNG